MIQVLIPYVDTITFNDIMNELKQKNSNVDGLRLSAPFKSYIEFENTDIDEVHTLMAMVKAKFDVNYSLIRVM